MISRANKTPLSDWWWTVDKFLLAAVFLLMAGGFMLSLSASPPVAQGLKLPPFHFVERHAQFLIPAIGILIGTSFLSPARIRQIAFFLLAGCLVALMLVPIIGFSAKGATRWLAFGTFLFQPSELLKPVFIIVSAWLFAEGQKRNDWAYTIAAIGLFLLVATLLILQPDLGQTILIALCWGAMVFLVGLPWIWVGGLIGAGVAAFGFAYMSFSHFAGRIDRFVTGTGDTFQVDRGLSAISNGGWFGTGPGEGLVKNRLPDSHTDFVFAVAAEEFGIALTMLLVCLFGFVVLRAFAHAFKERDTFVQLAVTGLAVQFGLQSIINMGVNLRLLPAKGMTLPFISYGGSSLLAVSLGMGLMIALTRKRADYYRRQTPVPQGLATAI